MLCIVIKPFIYTTHLLASTHCIVGVKYASMHVYVCMSMCDRCMYICGHLGRAILSQPQEAVSGTFVSVVSSLL